MFDKIERFEKILHKNKYVNNGLWRLGLVVIITAQFQTLNSRSAQVQILLATCREFAMVWISDTGPGWK